MATNHLILCPLQCGQGVWTYSLTAHCTGESHNCCNSASVSEAERNTELPDWDSAFPTVAMHRTDSTHIQFPPTALTTSYFPHYPFCGISILQQQPDSSRRRAFRLCDGTWRAGADVADLVYLHGPTYKVNLKQKAPNRLLISAVHTSCNAIRSAEKMHADAASKLTLDEEMLTARTLQNLPSRVEVVCLYTAGAVPNILNTLSGELASWEPRGPQKRGVGGTLASENTASTSDRPVSSFVQLLAIRRLVLPSPARIWPLEDHLGSVKQGQLAFFPV
ncbi:hypothetical protein B0H17DRAFT_1148082 [Mycena rosella]|uniref:Uncharacterized protein n=1 Tax=Mycena rosella TaxID=1033263 RepID=A0AAD7G1A4_MYCRO|nr:hypothetical protein B0H17DRAFT_1148082 [Mycena rosella]